jgi:hypothetical protein
MSKPMKKNYTLCLFILTITQVSVVLGSEIDSFTRRYETLEDASEIINLRANTLLVESVERANQGPNCNYEKLYKEIRKDFNIILRNSKFINYIVQSPDISRHKIDRKNSIYKNHGIFDGYLLARPAADRDGIGMGMTMNFNGSYIGTDKFEHMFGQGFNYFQKYYQKGETLRRTLRIGIANERFILGGNRFATGVFTFADLVANFQGMRFWNHILQKREDLLGENLGPYVSCKDNKWMVVKQIDFKNYVDDGFDEAINCSAIISSKGLKGVQNSLHELSERFPEHTFTCPLEAEKLNMAKTRYNIEMGGKKISEYLFNPWDSLTKYKAFWSR